MSNHSTMGHKLEYMYSTLGQKAVLAYYKNGLSIWTDRLVQFMLSRSIINNGTQNNVEERKFYSPDNSVELSQQLSHHFLCNPHQYIAVMSSLVCPIWTDRQVQFNAFKIKQWNLE